MKITIIGTGNMAAAFVKQLTAAGHQVRVTGRDPATVGETVAAVSLQSVLFET